jgi:hypothetical protein
MTNIFWKWGIDTFGFMNNYERHVFKYVRKMSYVYRLDNIYICINEAYAYLLNIGRPPYATQYF